MEQKYLIWSEEHGAWWGPAHHHNYTRSLKKACRYSLVEATTIVQRANKYLAQGLALGEVLVPDPMSFHETITGT